MSPHNDPADTRNRLYKSSAKLKNYSVGPHCLESYGAERPNSCL
jgi:hypothetical protein